MTLNFLSGNRLKQDYIFLLYDMGSRRNLESSNYRNPCLTLHQPWASLLVYGIKRIEGRSWPAPIRGRLWIHAAGKIPEPETIKAMEDFYREIYAMDGVTDLKFPEHYPVSRLIGCVDVVGCVTCEELANWEAIPASVRVEGQTPFCWLCEQPQADHVLGLDATRPQHLPTRQQTTPARRHVEVDVFALVPHRIPLVRHVPHHHRHLAAPHRDVGRHHQILVSEHVLERVPERHHHLARGHLVLAYDFLDPPSASLRLRRLMHVPYLY
ncbi:activating signal cointegrator-related family protein [Striga asiatica]|uniref:Activating signal cointegrator-related family protein n=1 Tax=Striga asiatica TaxID=4170 RepID=A0A5A7QC26_STRAF|nr:activating signal cointegrator-related family protein [Striga asiatica]